MSTLLSDKRGSTNLEVTDLQMKGFTDLIYNRAGIRIPLQKTTLLSNRIRRRLRKTGVEGFEQYLKLLKSLKAQDPEWDAFLQEVTTHETFLFRDEAQWQWMRKEYLPQMHADALAGRRTKTLRVWSAAASTGDEAHSIACCIVGSLPHYSQWKLSIVGTDIGIGAIEAAKAGVFGERAMRLVPDDLKKKHFKKAPDAQIWQAKPILTQMLQFGQHNLMEPFREPPFDLIFLKNVLIYFDRESKQTVIDHLRKAIRPGGLLVAGAAEGVSDLLTGMTRIHPWLYRQP